MPQNSEKWSLVPKNDKWQGEVEITSSTIMWWTVVFDGDYERRARIFVPRGSNEDLLYHSIKCITALVIGVSIY